MSTSNPQVDGYLRENKQWRKEMEALRAIARSCEDLVEEMKWRHPCYTLNGKNVVLIHGFKEYCALLFMKGALLRDPKKLLTAPGENTQAGRQIRFTNLREIVTRKSALKSYIEDAISIEESGKTVALKKTVDFKIPDEFQKQLNLNRALKTAFSALTPGRQRAYILHFSNAKQSATRAARVDKYLPKILKGKGLDD